MYCPGCGSEERQLSQFCRACGTDLRAVRVSLERPDEITASAVSAREQIGLALAERIRETETSRDLQRVAEDVLPQIEKFLESPEEKRLRRIRIGVVTASIGLGATILAVILSSFVDKGAIPLVGAGIVAFMIGLGLLINGLAFTIPRRERLDRSSEAETQSNLDQQQATTARSLSPSPGTTGVPAPSVTEHTTHQLKIDR